MCSVALSRYRGGGTPTAGAPEYKNVNAQISSTEAIITEKGIAYLKKKLNAKRVRVDIRYRFYDMKYSVQEIAGVIPPQLKFIAYALGWCGTAVDNLANRLIFDRFEHDDFLLNEIFRLNSRDILFGSANLSALIAACSFIYIGRGADGYPRLQVIDGGNATGIIDPVTNMLTEGYAVLERDENKRPTLEAYFRPGITEYYRNGRRDDALTLTHKAPYALLVPVIYRPDAKRPFGHSRISRACMHIVEAVVRTLRRSEVSAEFYSFPQRYVLGLSDEADKVDKAQAIMSAFLDFRKDEDGDKPSVGQFEQQSMAPYTEQVRMLASVFAGETGLTLDDLGFATENPSSEGAIRAAHENLRLIARRAQQTFGVGYLNAGYLAACLRDDYAYSRSAFADTVPAWYPIFEPDAAGLASIGDAILKMNQAQEGFMGARNIRALTGMTGDAE